MAIRCVEVDTRLKALAIYVRFNNALGFPRCYHAKWGPTPIVVTGRSPGACLCTAGTGAGVSALCPWAVKRVVRVRKHPTLTLFIVYPIVAVLRALLTAGESTAEKDLDDGVYSAPDEAD